MSERGHPGDPSGEVVVPTLLSLTRTLGEHLRLCPGSHLPDAEVTAVHVSELQDPRPYLSGGELLLTTGLALPTTDSGCGAYVSRVVGAEVSALALGLGPAHDQVPQRLSTACRAAGLPLLVVPAPTPFLTITTAYWDARSRSVERHLNDAVAAHRTLVDAALSPDPSAAVLQRLTRLVGGWAARLTADGQVEQVYPATFRDDAEALLAEAGRLKSAGVHSSASLESRGHVVVIHPLSAEGQVVGYLAAASARQLSPSHRQVVLTATALLSLDVVRDLRSRSEDDVSRRCVAQLVDLGFTDASRRLADVAGVPAPARDVHVVVLGGRDAAALLEELRRWCPDVVGVALDRISAWAVLPDPHPPLADLADRLLSADPTVRALASDLVPTEATSAVRARLHHRLSVLPPGHVGFPPATDDRDVARAVDHFAATVTAVVREALVSYLRNRGQWEAAAADIDIHRNTLRYRVATARRVLALDLDDPDVLARTWLALRERGLA